MKRRATKPKIALATHLGGCELARACDIVLADALFARGADPEFLLCDSALPACAMLSSKRVNPSELGGRSHALCCSTCFAAGVTHLRKHPVNMATAPLTAAVRERAAALARETPCEEIRGVVWRGIPVGAHAYAGALDYLARGGDEPSAEPVLRKYLEAAVLISAATIGAIERRGFEIVIAHSGRGVPQGAAVAAARAAGARVVVYEIGLRRGAFIFSHGVAPEESLPSEPATVWRGMDFSARCREDLECFIAQQAGAPGFVRFRDGRDARDFRTALEALAQADSSFLPHDRALAEKYAYHLFFRRMIPLPMINDDGGGRFSVDVEAMQDLRPGLWAGLDVICAGVLDGTPFIYPAEEMSAPFAHEERVSV